MSKRLPIEGQKPLPVKERPTCRYCGKPLQPVIYRQYTTSSTATTRTFTGKYGGYGDGYFCGQLHGYLFARVVARDRPGIYITDLKGKEEK